MKREGYFGYREKRRWSVEYDDDGALEMKLFTECGDCETYIIYPGQAELLADALLEAYTANE